MDTAVLRLPAVSFSRFSGRVAKAPESLSAPSGATFWTSGKTARITREQFERFVDEAFEASQARKAESRFSRFSEVWKIRTKTRFLVGAALLASSAVAAASGAAIAAGSLLAARTAMSAVGGYFAAGSLFSFVASRLGKDSFSKLLAHIERAKSRSELNVDVREIFERYEREEIATGLESARKRASALKSVECVVAVTAGCAMAIIGGSSVAEAALPAPHSPIPGSVIPAPSRFPISKPLEGVRISEIFDDIRHDHPGQRVVTLEQSVRRLEGLSQGIPLQESSRLSKLSSEAARVASDPSGKIASAMRELGYLRPGADLAEAARRLTEEKIASVLERAYSLGEKGRSVVGEVPSVSRPELAPVPVAESPATPSPQSPIPIGESVPIANPLPDPSPDQRKSGRIASALLAVSGGAAMLAGLSSLLAERMEKSRGRLFKKSAPNPSDSEKIPLPFSQVERLYRNLESGNGQPLDLSEIAAMRKSHSLPYGSATVRLPIGAGKGVVVTSVPLESVSAEDFQHTNIMVLPWLRFGGGKDFFLRFWKSEPTGFFRRLAGSAPDVKPVSVREVPG